jgi:hypothetical protein
MKAIMTEGMPKMNEMGQPCMDCEMPAEMHPAMPRMMPGTMTGMMGGRMIGRRKLIVGVGAAAVVVAWYLFRPELLFVDKTVNEAFPMTTIESSSRMPQMKLVAGEFRGIAHDTKGMAAVYDVDGKRVLRLTGFETSNGPDVHVLLVAAMDAMDDKTVKDAGYIDLGSLKGNVGDQNYELPAHVDLAKYQACTIWCKRFGVNFGTAPLAMQ